MHCCSPKVANYTLTVFVRNHLIMSCARLSDCGASSKCMTWRESVLQWISNTAASAKRMLIAVAAVSTYANYWVRAVDSTAAQSIRFAGKHRVSVRLSVSCLSVHVRVCALWWWPSVAIVCDAWAERIDPPHCAYIASYFDDNWHMRRAVHNSWPLFPPAAVHGGQDLRGVRFTGHVA